jgi:hypothetical protein
MALPGECLERVLQANPRLELQMTRKMAFLAKYFYKKLREEVTNTCNSSLQELAELVTTVNFYNLVSKIPPVIKL